MLAKNTFLVDEINFSVPEFYFSLGNVFFLLLKKCLVEQMAWACMWILGFEDL